ncbi:MAG TPA: hypothetical protein VFZ66_26320 [Herpetosiphonaceae bacterium]
MTNQPPDIPVGDIQLYDNYIPPMYSGDYLITVTHTLQGIQTGDPHSPQQFQASATQRFVVSAPQFTVDPSEVLNMYPPDGSLGQFADVLPHVVLTEPLLPWERKMPDRADPWLALLVFQEDELIDDASATNGRPGSPTHTITTTVGDFLGLGSQLLVPSITKEDDIPDDQVCTYIKLKTSVFQSVTPRLAEMPFLAHVRQINTGDKSMDGVNEHGIFSVVVCSRFPAIDTSETNPVAVRNVVHLVSMEGLTQYLVDNPVFTKSGKNDGSTVYDTIALLSLASWTFQCLPDPRENFQGLMLNLLAQEYDAQSKQHHPANLWLRLPPPSLDTSVAANAEVVRRIGDGYVALPYHTRTGEDTFAWYRGPLAPLLPTPLQKPGPFLTADAALIYDNTNGIFDCSLAAAWNIGRGLALSDKSFGQALLDFRRRAHRLTDQLQDRLDRDHFDTPDDISQLAQDNLLQTQFLNALDTQLVQDIGTKPVTPGTPPAPPAADDTDPKTAVENFLADPGNQQVIVQMVKDDLDPIAQWLARLLLLYPLPFDYLVPDPNMLPIESLRFFYVDDNWTGALLDGAQSLGLESSRQTFFYQMTSGLIEEAAFEAAKVLRDSLRGVDPSPGPEGETVISGLLLRSALVSGWPNLSVRPYNADKALLKILRMDHLAPDVLLCLFLGVPMQIQLSEPQEGFSFGIDEQGAVELRNLMPPQKSGDPLLGQALNKTFQIRDLSGQQALCMRPNSRVLNLAPASADGLIQQLQAQLKAAGQQLSSFGPADFAIQMVKGLEELMFDSQTS